MPDITISLNDIAKVYLTEYGVRVFVNFYLPHRPPYKLGDNNLLIAQVWVLFSIFGAVVDITAKNVFEANKITITGE